MPAKPKVIITCAVTGAIHTPAMSPHLPIIRQVLEGLFLEVATPDEAREVLQLKSGDQVAF